ncbi:MAG TPA: phosphotransferase [Mycobacteriales bacterium]|nr:phosphotransferase [Mycobacteriales bacterium]
MQLDPAQLRDAFGDDPGEVTVAAIDPDLRFHSVTGGVYRVHAEDGSSLVLKIVRHGHDEDPGALWVSGAEPDHRNYWKREWLAYDSRLLERLPGQLRAPRTRLTTEPSPDEAWIWMEDVEGRGGATWPTGDYDSAAFDLGTTQGSYAAGGDPLPSYDWLSRDWLRGWVDALSRHVPLLDDDAAWTGENAVFATLRERFADMWAARETLLAIVESAPSCVVHCDFWPTNLIAADDGTTVAVDWSQVGIGAVGHDLDQLTLDPVWMQVLPDGDLDALESHVLAAYLAGLRTSGFDCDAEDLRRWYAAAAACHYAPILAMYVDSLRDPERLAALEARHGRPIEAINADKARVVDRALTLGESLL